MYTAGLARQNEKRAKNEKAAQNADLLEMSPDEMTQGMKEQRQSAREHSRSRALDLMEMPPETRTPGKRFLISLVASMNAFA